MFIAAKKHVELKPTSRHVKQNRKKKNIKRIIHTAFTINLKLDNFGGKKKSVKACYDKYVCFICIKFLSKSRLCVRI